MIYHLTDFNIITTQHQPYHKSETLLSYHYKESGLTVARQKLGQIRHPVPEASITAEMNT